MTQGDLANAVGVSTAAVSKWETGASYPDITLLKPLARALGLTLDGLLDFHAEPDEDERKEIVKRLETVFESKGYSAGFAACEEVLREYPSCGSLKLMAAGLYYRYLSMAVVEMPDAEGTLDEICRNAVRLLEQAEAETSDPDEKQASRILRASTLIMQKRFDEAEKLLDLVTPGSQHDPEMLYMSLYLSKGENDEAEKLCEKMLLSGVTKAFTALIVLSDVAQRKGHTELARNSLSAYKAVSELFGLDGSAGFQSEVRLAVQEGDRERALSAVEKLVSTRLESSSDYSENPFFSALQTRVPSKEELKAMDKVMLKAFDEEPYTFLQGEPRFEAAVSRLRESLEEA